MQILRSGNRMIVNIMQQSIIPDRDYRLSLYAFPAVGDNGGLFVNVAEYKIGAFSANTGQF